MIQGSITVEPERPPLTQKEAFFQGFPFTLFPLGGMPTFRYNPGDPGFFEPALERLIPGCEYESFAGVDDITDTHFRTTTLFMGLYETSKIIAFDRLCFYSKEQTIIQPSESALQQIEAENDWLLKT